MLTNVECFYVYFFLFGNGTSLLACFAFRGLLGMDNSFGAAVFIFHVGVERSMGSIGFSTTLSAYIVFGDVLVFTSVYFLHKYAKYYGVIRRTESFLKNN
jgi:hypothetical protein